VKTGSFATDPPLSGPHNFATTQWGTVLAAVRGSDSQLSALDQLCRTYWYPLYAYIRRRGNDSEDAKDLTQEFFAQLLSKEWLAEIVPEGGRFRSFLLTAVNRFLANVYDRSRAKKRGGCQQFLSLDAEAAEAQYARELTTTETPERTFERRWALTVLDAALMRLRMELVDAGKLHHFELLSPFLFCEPSAGEYEEVGRLLSISQNAVRVAVHRLRQRYREAVHREIAGTLVHTGELAEEMQHLFAALRS
jgi:RNA polymerase sigma factor (sigma-70 family)